MIRYHEMDSLADTFVGNRYFGGCDGSEEMRHLVRKYFNLLLVGDRYRAGVMTVKYLPCVKAALNAVLKRMDEL